MINLSHGMQNKFSSKLKKGIPDQLQKLIDQGFSDKKGAIIFSAFEGLIHIKLVNPRDTFYMHKDLTGFECYANKILLDEYIKNKSELSL